MLARCNENPCLQWLETWHSSSPWQAYWFRFKRSMVRVKVRESLASPESAHSLYLLLLLSLWRHWVTNGP